LGRSEEVTTTESTDHVPRGQKYRLNERTARS
jgi:hypothetical protein